MKHGRGEVKKTGVVGVLNVTPDSFYPGSRILQVELATVKAVQMLDQGAVAVDIGGESTRPGSVELDAKEEIERVVPVISSVISERPSAVLSVDTRHPETARAAILAGASMINDITGLQSPEMLRLVSISEIPVVIMHMKGTPQNMQENPQYDDAVTEILEFLLNGVSRAVENGVREENIILDPGIGFGKRYQDNIDILSNIGKFVDTGFPIMIGHSRKSFLGSILDLPVEDRLEGTLAVTAYCAMNSVAFVRVHDVEENIRVVRTIRAIRT